MDWVTLIAGILTLAGVTWTVYRTDLRGHRDLHEARDRELREKRREVYAEFIVCVEEYRFSLIEARRRVEIRLASDEVLPDALPVLFDVTDSTRKFVVGVAKLDLYGTPVIRQAARAFYDVALQGDGFVEDAERERIIHGYIESIVDIARQDLGITESF